MDDGQPDAMALMAKGDALMRTRRWTEAADAFIGSISAGADGVIIWVRLAQALNGVEFYAPDDGVRHWLLRLARYPGVPHSHLNAPITRYLRTGPAFRALWDAAEAPDFAPQPADLQTLNDPLLIALLNRGSPLSPAMERLVAGARRLLIADDIEALEFRCAIAASAIASEFAWFETPDEAARIDALEAKVSASGNITFNEIALYAAYRPLHRAPWAGGLVGRSWPAPFDELIKSAVLEPLTEQEIAGGIPRLGAIEGEVSKAVQAQYEENPYPRWQTMPRPSPDPIPEVIRRFCPDVDLTSLRWRDEPDILIAGCGTGRQAIDVALCHPAGKVLAIDLSRASLAYAKRKAIEMEVANLEFAQADLMEADFGDRRFDLVESTGVLHHLGQPVEGWRRLVGLLRPGGLMTIALYSRTARAWLSDLRARYGVRGDAQGIRAFRQQLMADEPSHPILSTTDFYSLSECRDLVFHVQEMQFSLDEIAQILPSLGLRFLGFVLPPAQLAAYEARFPDDPARTNLAHWAELEAEQPRLFIGMYHFWVIKTGP